MELTTDTYMSIPVIHGAFVDCILTDEADNLVFGSFWGRDTAIREFQGSFEQYQLIYPKINIQ
jgi:hypothetical protein